MEPDGDACCLREPDGGGAAGAGGPDEGHAAVRTECDHLGVAAVTGGPAVAVPVGWVGLDLVAGRVGSVDGGDRLGSSWTGAMDQEDATGVAGQDDREGPTDLPAPRSAWSGDIP